MAKSDNTAPDIAVISRLRRVVHLPWNPAAGDKNKAQPSVTIVPGANYISADKAERIGLASALSTFGGSIAVEDPAKISPYEASEIAAISGSREALHRWRSLESRAPVLAAIDQRLMGKAAV